MSTRSVRAIRGLTLIEIVVVLGIILVLYGLVAPVVMKARMRSQETACGSNLKQTFVALKLYEEDYGEFPHFRPSEQLVPTYLTAPEVLVCPLEYRNLAAEDPNPRDTRYAVLSSYVWPCTPGRARDDLRRRRGDDLPAVGCPVHAVVSSGPPAYQFVRLNGSLDRVPIRPEGGGLQEY